ncbi:MAG TPA: hypothetical protein VKR55_22655, partial [Bradyrhizobium sp.]|uniref:hypothetical protein n=1 Tax=Bradyrhizobium sp. TaxID=376 RepID=UPI002B90CB4F
SPDAAPDQAPADRTQVASMPVSPAPASSDPDDAVISTAISAHIDSVVNDARRNVSKLTTNR